MSTAHVIQQYRDSSRLEPHELVSELNDGLGPTLVAALSGGKSRAQAYVWAKAGAEPRAEAWNRLQFAHQIWRLLENAEGAGVARRWFIGGNPLLAETSPVVAIRDDRHAEVRRAATAYIDGDIDE